MDHLCTIYQAEEKEEIPTAATLKRCSVFSSILILVYTVHLVVCVIVCERVRDCAPRAVVWGAKR